LSADPPADPLALRIAELAVGAGRVVVRWVPRRVRKRVEDGIFHYIFQKTRVENDAYGWRPDTPGGGAPPPGYGGAGGPPGSSRDSAPRDG
jgi:hypothetical protein